MLDLFKRPNDPQEHNYVYIIPALAMAAAVFAAQSMGVATAPLVNGIGLVASVLCIASIACLARQATARTGGLDLCWFCVGVVLDRCWIGVSQCWIGLGSLAMPCVLSRKKSGNLE